MPAYNTKWGEIVARVLSAYPMGSPGLVLALETLCGTAFKEGEASGQSKTAFDVCDGIHDGPPTGLKCLSCYHVEVNYAGEQVVIAEVEAERQRRASDDAAGFGEE